MKLDDPDLAELVASIDEAESDAAGYYGRKALNRSVRNCEWDGQSPDGRKWKHLLDREPFPWNGAHDTVVRLVDVIANRNVRLKKRATMQSRPTCSGREAGDAANAAVVNEVMNWLLYTHCLEMLERETTIGGNIQEDCGLVIFGIFWNEQTRTEIKRLTLEELQALYAQTRDPRVALLVTAVLDPLSEETAAELLEEFVPGQGTRANVRALRKQGFCEYENEYVFQSTPEWVAMEPWEDVYFPAATCDLQRQPYIVCRELLDETELRSRVLTERYDEDWVDEACEHKGEFRRNIHSDNLATLGLYNDPNDKRIEVWTHFRKQSTKSGATRVVRTVFHCSIGDSWGWNGLMPYEHALYPFVGIPRERRSRRLLDSRGVGELLVSNQQTMKHFRDRRNDRADIAISPPMRVPANRGKLAQLMGPRAEIPERRQGEISPYVVAPADSGSLEGEREARRDANEYAGRNDEGVDPDEVELTKQDLANNWLTGMKLCMAMTLQLAQQYLPDAVVARVAGTLPAPFQATREDIQGQFDITLEFDVTTLNSKALGQKLDYITKAVVPLDVSGVIDRPGLVKFIMSAVDPRMAELLVRDTQSATASEAADEQNALAQLWAGIEPPLAQPGQNAQLRLQVIQQQMQANPEWATRFGQDPIFQKMLKARVQSLTFQIQQTQINPQIGREGAAPALAPGVPKVLPETTERMAA